MYEFIKGLHNILRWVVVFSALFAVYTAFWGLFARSVWTRTERNAGLIFTSSLNLQFVVGLVLYVLSPLTKGAFQDFATAMANSQLRFFAVEHAGLMILAVLVAQLAYTFAKRAKTDSAKFLRAAIGYSLASLLIVFAIPWWRPLIPGLA